MPNKPDIQSFGSASLASMMHVAARPYEAIDKSAFQLLIIDDNTSILHSTCTLLEANGYSCSIADGGEAGLKILKQGSIDIVLLDLSMPGVDGYKVLETINSLDLNVDVIVVSGEATFNNATRVFRYGAIDFLNKPYKPAQLISLLQKVVYQRGLKQHLNIIQQQLSESERRYRFIVSNSPDIIYMIDHRGNFTFINDRITDLLGFEPEQLVGCHFSSLIYKDDIPLAEHIFNERRTGERASHNVELRLKCTNPEIEPKSFEAS